MTKKEIRLYIKHLKAQFPNSQKEICANLVTQKIEQSNWFIGAKNILTYYALPDELNTLPQLNRWATNKSLYLPRVNDFTLEILPYANTKIGSYNIFEPLGNNIVHPSTIDLIIVPGIAFDASGMRLGRGKGFYDRLLKETTALKIGICYDFQLIDDIPHEIHDIPMDAIITPTQQFIINNKHPWQ